MKKTSLMVQCALFGALCTIATVIITVPAPLGGYINAGDIIVILSSWFLRPGLSFFSASIGSFFADILLGYAIYAPATFIIKGIMALVSGYIFINLKKYKYGSVIISSIVAEIIMIFGYFIYAIILFGNARGAILTIPLNALQGVFSVVVSCFLYRILNRKIKF